VGVLNWMRNHRLSDPVPGRYHLTSCSVGSSGAMYSNCRMEGVVTAEGLPPTAVGHYCTAPTKKWPSPGQELPVLVDRANPRRLRIQWRQVATGRQRGRQAAQAFAAMMAQQQATGGGAGWPGGSAGSGGVFTADFSALPPQFQTLAEDAQRRARQAMDAFSANAANASATNASASAANRPGPASMRSATAVVLAVHDADGSVGAADITLDIKAPGGGYTAVTRISFRTAEQRARVAVPGATLPVLIDPADRNRVVIDTSRI
jgi:hypothetical protein